MDKDSALKLINRFQSDIVYDCHSLSARYGRSDAVRKILEAAIDMLPFIAAHLSTYEKATDIHDIEMDARIAWCWLLRQIHDENDIGEPPIVGNFEGWVKWAKGYKPAADSAAT